MLCRNGCSHAIVLKGFDNWLYLYVVFSVPKLVLSILFDLLLLTSHLNQMTLSIEPVVQVSYLEQSLSIK